VRGQLQALTARVALRGVHEAIDSRVSADGAVSACWSRLACAVDITTGVPTTVVVNLHFRRWRVQCGDRNLVWINDKCPNRPFHPVKVVSVFMNGQSTVVPHENTYDLGGGRAGKRETIRCLWPVSRVFELIRWVEVWLLCNFLLCLVRAVHAFDVGNVTNGRPEYSDQCQVADTWCWSGYVKVIRGQQQYWRITTRGPFLGSCLCLTS
jgi:hypothetical protein